jgi:translation initiation factor IF-1
MTRKVLLGLLLVGLVGILAAGAVIRTIDKTAHAAEAPGLGQGWSSGLKGQAVAAEPPRWGQQANEQPQANLEAAAAEWLTLEGTVVQVPADGHELLVRCDDGSEASIGTGPGYMEEMGFTLQPGDRVKLQGYWDGDEFKAARVTRLSDGQTITLRDEGGRPAWAGRGRRASEGGFWGQGRGATQ